MPLQDAIDRYPPLVQRLKETRRRRRMAHAYLFSGDQLSTLEQLALHWVQACACPSPADDGDACGTCARCRQIEQSGYLHMHRLKPKSKARQILIDEIRELEHHLHLKSAGEPKIGFIVEADRMNPQAQNAFLKTLEEPTPDSFLVLVTVNPGELLPTIRSRCQHVALRENRQEYSFTGQENFLRGVARMAQGEGAIVAVDVAQCIILTLQHSREEVLAVAKERQKETAVRYAEMEPELRKRLEEEFQAAVTAEYLARRTMIISALHTWFAQEFMRATGIGNDMVPNPEFYDAVPSEFRDRPVAARAAHRSLELTEELIASLRFNVDEQLAIQDYCLKVCEKS